MSVFDVAIDFVLRNEGAYEDDFGFMLDSYGIVQCGVEMRDLEDMKRKGIPGWDVDGDGEITTRDIRAMNPERASRVFKGLYWDRPLYRSRDGNAIGYEKIVDPEVAIRLFDMGIVMGRYTAVKQLQFCFRSVGTYLVVDGAFGPKTLSTVNSFAASPLLVPVFKMSCAARFVEIVSKYPKHDKHFTGWLNRVFKDIN